MATFQFGWAQLNFTCLLLDKLSLRTVNLLILRNFVHFFTVLENQILASVNWNPKRKLGVSTHFSEIINNYE